MRGWVFLERGRGLEVKGRIREVGGEQRECRGSLGTPKGQEGPGRDNLAKCSYSLGLIFPHQEYLKGLDLDFELWLKAI